MINLGHMSVRNCDDVIEARKKIRLLAKSLGFNGIHATRLESIISEIGRFGCCNGKQLEVGVGLTLENTPELVMSFQSLERLDSIYGMEYFFDRLHSEYLENGATKLTTIRHLPDSGSTPSSELIAEQKEMLARLSRNELLSLMKEKNAELNSRAVELELLTEELDKKNQQLEALVRVDELTGLSNRRHYDETMIAEIRRASRIGKPLSLILCDIDYFKRYNDHYGHLAGDDCLRKIGTLLRRVFRRESDLPARYGGEEFAVILPDTPANEALLLAETLCREMSEMSLPHAFSDVAEYISLSAGVVSSLVTKAHTVEWFTGQADTALYRSKVNGRNRVTEVVFEEN